MADPVTCLNCHKHLAGTRGLCQSCYSILGKQMRAGGATWASLEREGRCKSASGTPWRTGKKGA
jgi:hypothetical protein